MKKLAILLLGLGFTLNAQAHMTYFSDGSWAQSYGHMTYFSDGSWAQSY